VPVDLSGSFAFPCCRASLNWRAIDGTAHNGVDYTGPVYFENVLVQPGATRAFIEIPLNAAPHPDDRSFDVEIVFASFPMTRSRATVTISGTPPTRRRSAR